MSRRRRYLVACLAGHGIGPEVMAEASRALAEVSRLHGFVVDEAHLPFGREAVTRSGHPLPAATRSAYLGADAILFASSSQPALASVKEGLDLAASVTQMRLPAGDVTVFAPLVTRPRTGQSSGPSRLRAHAAAASPPCQSAGRGSPGSCLREQTTTASRSGTSVSPRLSLPSSGLLSTRGPSLFGPTHGSALDIAGQGVANPSEMLLAAALMLAEGLGRRSAAETLQRSVEDALSSGYRTPDMSPAGVAATTREFVDVVLDLMPSARRDDEFAIGGVL